MSYAIDAAIEWCEAGHREECAEMPLGGGWTKGTSCICGREHMDAVLSEYNKLRAELAKVTAERDDAREELNQRTGQRREMRLGHAAELARAMAVVEAARNVCRDGMTQRLIDEIAAFDAAKEKS